ncbi:MAG: guanylate kinase [Deltaproteobacteria bacterium]|nr:guanylate kinase [Deltaproteobacteria bacterium]
MFVISAPSGSGKTTICRRLLDRVEDLELSISYTTREMKPGEVDGKDYYFIDAEKFDKMVDLKEFVEFASVYGNRYGTSREMVRSIVSRGLDAVLEIDIQGGRKVKEALPEAVLVGIFPPDWGTLTRRLVGRGRDSMEEMEARLNAAGAEMRELLSYDYLVVNEELEKAVTQVEWIVRAHRLRRDRMLGRAQKILMR